VRKYSWGATQAQIAVMRKMIIIAHSLYIARRVNPLWKNNEKYSAKVYQKACGVL